MKATAWTNDNLLVNLRGIVDDVRGQYGIPSIDHVPDFELTRLRDAWHNDIVSVGKHIGIVYDVTENRGVRELSIVLDTLRVVIKRVSA